MKGTPCRMNKKKLFVEQEVIRIKGKTCSMFRGGQGGWGEGQRGAKKAKMVCGANRGYIDYDGGQCTIVKKGRDGSKILWNPFFYQTVFIRIFIFLIQYF